MKALKFMNSAGKASVYVDWTRDGLDERGGRDLDKGQTLATVAYQRLRDDILAGALGPNTKLLMKELSARYQLGIAPIREALHGCMPKVLCVAPIIADIGFLLCL